jgi:hypothetical protein
MRVDARVAKLCLGAVFRESAIMHAEVPVDMDRERGEVVSPEMAEVLRAKTGAERIRIASDLYASARKMLMYHLRCEHPGWTERQIIQEAARRLSHGAK